MDACLRRAGPRASGLLREAAKENSDFYKCLKAAAARADGSCTAATSCDPPPPPSPPPPTARRKSSDEELLDLGSSSDDGDLFSRDGSSDGDGLDISSAFLLSLDDAISADADLIVAYVRACAVASASWRSEAAVHAPILLQRMCARAREMAEASCSSGNRIGAAVATAAFLSHIARLHLMALPHLPASHHPEPAAPMHRHARAQSHGARSAGMVDDDCVHLARLSGAGLRDEHARARQPQHHQPSHSMLHLTWMHVWRSCRRAFCPCPSQPLLPLPLTHLCSAGCAPTLSAPWSPTLWLPPTSAPCDPPSHLPSTHAMAVCSERGLHDAWFMHAAFLEYMMDVTRLQTNPAPLRPVLTSPPADISRGAVCRLLVFSKLQARPWQTRWSVLADVWRNAIDGIFSGA